MVLTVTPNMVSEPITPVNIESAVGVLQPTIDEFLSGAGGTLEGQPTEVTYADLPGVRFEASGAEAAYMRAVWIFDGTTAYLFSCLSDRSGAEEVKRACDQVFGSLTIG